MGIKVAATLLLAVALPCLASGAVSGAYGQDCAYGMLDSARHGEWYTGAQKICYCNDGKWEQCYDKSGSSPPPYVPADCSDNGQTIKHGQWYEKNGQSCMCNEGLWAQCKPIYVPPPTPSYKPCNDYPNTIAHNQWFKRSNGKECLCNNGVWTSCKNPPNQCWSNGRSVYNGGYLDTNTERCKCEYGRLVDCEDLCEAGKAQLMFLFDTSKSITEDKDSSSDGAVGKENWRAMQDFTASAVRQVPIGPWKTMVSLARFSDSPSTRLSFKSSDSGDKNKILKSLYGWEPELKGRTYLGRALNYVQDQYTRDYKWSKILVVLTDGNADDDIGRVSQEMRQDGYIIWAVGVGKNIEFEQLMVLTGQTNRVLMVDSFQALANHVQFLTRAICYNYNA